MYSAEQAREIGLIDEVATEDSLDDHAMKAAVGYVGRYGPAFESIKKLLRSDTADLMRDKDYKYRSEMIDIWYSEETWARLQMIKIRG